MLREDAEALAHVLGMLEARGARYRFGAPLDVRWMRGGWSAHFEHAAGRPPPEDRFVTRPPRLSEDRPPIVVDGGRRPRSSFSRCPRLALVKMTDREKDWPVIGEFARLLPRPSRSAPVLPEPAGHHQASPRPSRATARGDRRTSGARRGGRRRGGARGCAGRRAARSHQAERGEARGLFEGSPSVAGRLADVERETRSLPLLEAHATIVARALSVLPFEVPRDV